MYKSLLADIRAPSLALKPYTKPNTRSIIIFSNCHLFWFLFYIHTVYILYLSFVLTSQLVHTGAPVSFMQLL